MTAKHSPSPPSLPREPIDALLEPLTRFLHVEASSGVILLCATIVALTLANSPMSAAFLGFWKLEVGFQVGSFAFHHSLKHLINDGLMAVFFFVIGLEVKREIVVGELRELRSAALPIAAAIGGMIVPAAVYFAIEAGRPGERGWGIPMATDIAFVVGCLALLGSRVPRGLRVLLLSLAIADDIGAILVIAVGYSSHLNMVALAVGGMGIAVVALMARLGVRRFAPYTIVGVLIWIAFHESGVHATVAGVILGLMTPARSYISEGAFADWLRRTGEVFEGGSWSNEAHRTERLRGLQIATRETVSPLEYLEQTLHPWVGFFIMPVFALANAGVPMSVSSLADRVAIAAMLGLIVGKSVGIFLASWLSVKLGLARLPEGVSWRMLAAGGCLAGIGFTMALFIAELALDGELLDNAKAGILVGSAVSAVLGLAVLILWLPRTESAKT